MATKPIPTTTPESDASPVVPPNRWRFSRASINLTMASAAFSALAFVTGPLLARALGPAGRGDLAAILVPLSVTGPVAVLGLDIFAARQAARGRSVGTLALSLGVLVLGIGVIVLLAGIPLSALLAENRPVVHDFLLIGFASMPLILLGLLLIGICSGLERWRLVIATRLVPGGLVAGALVVLFLTDALTVSSAAVVYLLTSISAVLIVAPVLRGQRFRFDWRVVKKAVPFGARVWVGTTSDLANVRLDQVLMITLVSPSELGLYAVAVNIGSFAWIITGGISPPLLARISSGELALAPRTLRTVLTLVALLTVVVAVSTPLVLTLLFGREFIDAARPTWLLLAAGLPVAGITILTQTLNGVGRPGLAGLGHGAALLITVPGLLLLLPVWGAIGAAFVSLVAYTANFAILLVATIRTCDMTLRELLVPTGSDLAWLRELVRSRLRLPKGEVGS